MKVVHLKASLKSLGLNVEGRKAELFDRLVNALVILEEDPYLKSPVKRAHVGKTHSKKKKKSVKTKSENKVGKKRKARSESEGEEEDSTTRATRSMSTKGNTTKSDTKRKR
jgi:hypothetical protein